VRVNSSRYLVVQSFGSPTRPLIIPEGQDPFWTTGIFIRELFGSRAGVDMADIQNEGMADMRSQDF
jgi:hypothetical protein